MHSGICMQCGCIIVRKHYQQWNHVSAQVSVKWPLTPHTKMIYETARPPGYCPAGPFLISISAHYVVTLMFPNLHLQNPAELCPLASPTVIYRPTLPPLPRSNMIGAPSSVFFGYNCCLLGNRSDFHVQMSVSPLPAITGPSPPEIGAWDTAWII